MSRGVSRALILAGSGAVGCVAFGPVGLIHPLFLAVLWLAEMGAFE